MGEARHYALQGGVVEVDTEAHLLDRPRRPCRQPPPGGGDADERPAAVRGIRFPAHQVLLLSLSMSLVTPVGWTINLWAILVVGRAPRREKPRSMSTS